jgi:hypothetical protein
MISCRFSHGSMIFSRDISVRQILSCRLGRIEPRKLNTTPPARCPPPSRPAFCTAAALAGARILHPPKSGVRLEIFQKPRSSLPACTCAKVPCVEWSGRLRRSGSPLVPPPRTTMQHQVRPARIALSWPAEAHRPVTLQPPALVPTSRETHAGTVPAASDDLRIFQLGCPPKP